MNTYIALLRGINVSGQKKISMSELRILFEELKFSSVTTYIQSGNVVFKTRETSKAKLADRISKGIKNKFGFDVNVIIKSPAEIEYLLLNNPFIKKKKDTGKLYVTFLSGNPAASDVKKLQQIDFGFEEFIIDGESIFLFFPDGYGKAKLNNNFFENKLKVTATTRNWKTVHTLFTMAAS